VFYVAACVNAAAAAARVDSGPPDVRPMPAKQEGGDGGEGGGLGAAAAGEGRDGEGEHWRCSAVCPGLAPEACPIAEELAPAATVNPHDAFTLAPKTAAFPTAGIAQLPCKSHVEARRLRRRGEVATAWGAV